MSFCRRARSPCGGELFTSLCVSRDGGSCCLGCVGVVAPDAEDMVVAGDISILEELPKVGVGESEVRAN